MGGMETAEVAPRLLRGFFGSTRAATVQEILERFVEAAIVHPLQDFVDIGKEVAFGYSAFTNAPVVSAHFGDRDFVFSQCVPDFRRTAVNEFRAEFNGNRGMRLVSREHPSAAAVAGLENDHGATGL